MSGPWGRPAGTSDEELDRTPWPGLAAFTEKQKRLFYGRSAELDELHRRVERMPLCVLFGQSGLGKTSLLHAGLFPRLRAVGYLPVSIRIDYTPEARPPEDQIRRSLDEALAQAGVSAAGRPREKETLWEYLHRAEGPARSPDGRPLIPILVFDQFEELFTIGRTRVPARADELVEVLAALVENRVPDAVERRLEKIPDLIESLDFDRTDHRVLVSLREDYLPHLQDLRRKLPSVMENAMRLSRLDERQALEAVLGPGGDLVTPAVARRIVAFVAGAGQVADSSREGSSAGVEVEPALLSLVCRELDHRRLATDPPAPMITEDLLEGSSEDILRDFYDRSLADQPPAVRAFVEDELLTPGAQGDKVFRESMSLERAHRLLANRGVSPAALETLEERRLLHKEQRLGITRVELTHDVLIDVVRRSRAARVQREAVEQAERETEATRRRLWQSRRRAAVVVAGLAVLAVGAGLIAGNAVRSNRRLEDLNAQLKVTADSLRAQEKIAVELREEADSIAANEKLAADSARRMTNTALVAQQSAEAAHANALRQKVTADSLRGEADTVKKLYNAWMGSAVDALSDSSFQRPETAGLYDAFLDISASHLGRILTASGRSLPEMMLQARIQTVRAMRERQAASQPGARARDSVEARAVAEQAIALARELTRRSDAPEVRSLAVRVFQESGSVLDRMNDARGALVAATEGINVAEGLDPGDDNLVLERLTRLHELRGRALLQQRDSAGAEEAQSSAVAIARRNVARRATPRARETLSAALDAYGNVLRTRRKPAAALPAFREQLQLDQQLAAADTSVAAQRNLAWSWGKMGLVYEDLDSLAAAEAAYVQRLEIRQRIARRSASQSDRQDLTAARDVLGRAYPGWSERLLARGDTAGALAAAQRGVAALDSLWVRNRGDVSLGKWVADHQGRLGRFLFLRDRFPAAVAAYQARADLRRELRAASDTAVAVDEVTGALGGLAFYLLFVGRPADALEASRQALQIGPTETWLNTNLAHALVLLGRNSEAEAVYRRYVGQVIEQGPDRTWERVVREDLCALVRTKAMSVAQADRVDGWLGSGGSGNGWRPGCQGVDVTHD